MNHTRGSDPTITAENLLRYISRAHRGKGEGVPAAGLATGMGVKASPANLRKLRGVVEYLREMGMPICARPETGYFYGVAKDEIEETIGILKKRATTAWKQATAMEEKLRKQGEQKSLKPPGPSPKEKVQTKLDGERWQDSPDGRMKIARWQVRQEKVSGATYRDDDGLAAERAAVRAEQAGYGNSEDIIRGESALDEYTRIANEDGR